jgi:hypothetical protein
LKNFTYCLECVKEFDKLIIEKFFYFRNKNFSFRLLYETIQKTQC